MSGDCFQWSHWYRSSKVDGSQIVFIPIQPAYINSMSRWPKRTCIELVVWHSSPSHIIKADWNLNNFINTLKPMHNGRQFPDAVFKCIFLAENVWIPITISLKFIVPKGPTNNIPALFQIMAWRRPGDKPLSEPMMVWFPTHICVIRPQWLDLSVSILKSQQLFKYLHWIHFHIPTYAKILFSMQ